jgi:hypothetical protein
MTDRRRVIWTRWLVLIGIALGYLSYGTKKLGIGELYPFADWRLYSAPVGINEEASTFRVYSYDERSRSWRRHPLEPGSAFTRKESAYMVNYWSRRVQEDSDPDERSLQALETAAALFAPEDASHRVVEESYFSFPLYENPERYDTSTVAVFDR